MSETNRILIIKSKEERLIKEFKKKEGKRNKER